MNAAGVKPDCECFDPGHIANTAPLIDMGLLRPPVQFFPIPGVLGGAPAHVPALRFMADLVPESGTWEVIGIGRRQWPLVDAATGIGGNVRVGVEDNFYLPSGEMAASNGDLVAEAARRAQKSGRSVATPAEARRLLSLPDPPDRSGVPD